MLAPNYFKWPGQVWFFSDPHFNHTNILKYERTEFETIEEHNEFIIKQINKTISLDDTLVCLGDIGTGWKECFDKIKKCKKILLLGNHDKENKINYKQYFNEVYDGPLFVNKFIVVSHEPIPVSEHFLNIHGHLHCSNLDDNNINHKNVSVKMNNYKLFSLSDAYDLIMDKPRIRARFLSEWYADNYVFTNERIDCYIYKDTGHIIPQETIKEALKIAGIQLASIMSNEYARFCEFYKQTKFLPVKESLELYSTDKPLNLAEKLIIYWREHETPNND